MGLRSLGVSALGFRPYSLRRGGATAFYRRTANLQATVERGRWAHVRVARIYICDGLGMETEMRFPTVARHSIVEHATELLDALNIQ